MGSFPPHVPSFNSFYLSRQSRGLNRKPRLGYIICMIDGDCFTTQRFVPHVRSVERVYSFVPRRAIIRSYSRIPSALQQAQRPAAAGGAPTASAQLLEPALVPASGRARALTPGKVPRGREQSAKESSSDQVGGGYGNIRVQCWTHKIPRKLNGR